MSHFDRFVGIDIAKNRLDIYCHPDGLAFCVANPSEWYRPAAAKAGGGGVAFGCEATGGYEDLLLVTLSQAGTPGYCLHPADILAFARLKGKRAKTDARDAKAIGPSPRRRRHRRSAANWPRPMRQHLPFRGLPEPPPRRLSPRNCVAASGPPFTFDAAFIT